MNPKLQRTRQYGQFSFSSENREVRVAQLKPAHARLRKSMERYGFLPAFPIMVNSINGRFVVKDGQHRLTFAKELGLEVYFVIDDSDIDVAKLNQTQAGWSLTDYAERWARDGLPHYATALAFAREYQLSASVAFSVLRGEITTRSCGPAIRAGAYKITARPFAERVAALYRRILEITGSPGHRALFECLAACCHLDDFDDERLPARLSKNPGMLGRPGTRDGYLQELEEIYNFHSHSRFPLKFAGEELIRSRKVAVKRA